MSDVLLDISDVMLALADRGRIRICAPGLAVIDPAGDRLLIGAAAAARQRHNPRAVHDRYWQALDRQPLVRTLGRARSHADLAWMQLGDIAAQAGPGEGWLLAVPGHYDDDALALLCGIARSLGLTIDAMAPRALLIAAGTCPGRDSLVIDIGRHRIGLEHVALRDGQLQCLERSTVQEAPGLKALMEDWARLAADAFVEQCRFDPAHNAAAEQALYDRLPEWLGILDSGRPVTARLEFGGRSFSASLAPEPFERLGRERLAPLGEALAGLPDSTVVLEEDMGGLPGLRRRLEEARPGGLELAARPAWTRTAFSVLTGLIEPGGAEDEIWMIEAVPAPAPNRDAAVEAAGLPTHVRHGDRIVELAGAVQTLTLAGGALKLERDALGRVLLRPTGMPADLPLTLNGEQCDGDVLAPARGDRVAVGDETLEFLGPDRDATA